MFCKTNLRPISAFAIIFFDCSARRWLPKRRRRVFKNDPLATPCHNRGLGIARLELDKHVDVACFGLLFPCVGAEQAYGFYFEVFLEVGELLFEEGEDLVFALHRFKRISACLLVWVFPFPVP